MDRKAQLHSVVKAYFDALRTGNFDLIPFTENVSLRAPLAPGGVHKPLTGKENLRKTWWAPIQGGIGSVRILDVFFNDDLTAVVAEAEVEVKANPSVILRVADRFTVNQEGKIAEQENHFDPRDLTNPGWNKA